jgi:spermidine/putrescine transport system substrate-binding protein
VSDPQDPNDHLNILAPRQFKHKFDRMHREVEQAAGRRINRREALGVGGLALLAAACGGSTTSGGNSNTNTGSSAPADTLAGKPLESQLIIYNWSQYDDPSTYTKFKKLPAEAAAGMSITETYYSSNDELLAKLAAGGGPYDIIVPSQNAVAELIAIGQLMALDKKLIPNLKNIDPAWSSPTEPTYDPGSKYSVVKDVGITMFFYRHDLIKGENPKTMLDFYNLLPKGHAVGRTNILDGAEEVIPLAAMALNIDPNTGDPGDFDKIKKFLLGIRKNVTTISSYGYINDASAGKIVLSQGWNGDVRRIVAARAKQGDITAVVPDGTSERWADNWCIPANAQHPVAAHAWINWLLTPSTAVTEMLYHNYTIPMQAALSKMPAAFTKYPYFNVKADVLNRYKFILNPTAGIVNTRGKIYQEFKAA